ncbi:hypothetical protein ACFLXI_05775 [Chloroflexota bacterium]
MITCPWCGTNYLEFQFNCNNCGGSLPLPPDDAPEPVELAAAPEISLAPPLPPRHIPSKVIGRIMLTDAGAITGGVFLLLGAIFLVVGIALVIPVVTLFVGLPFAGLGFIFFIVGGILFYLRYGHARQTVDILRDGQAALGEITHATQNYHVQVNNRYPWVIQYQFKVHGRTCRGKLSTLSQPDLSQQPGKPVYVLYQLDDPNKNTLFPSPYGYYGLGVDQLINPWQKRFLS